MKPKRILLLPTQLANQIAAGEVIERPSSIVKELLENSLDAESTYIEILLEKAGMQRIQISDNGRGINKDDLPLAVSRHATSKITSLHDLETLFTLGFRGEALASMASVSQLKIASKPLDQQQAWQIAVSGREDLAAELTPIAHPEGTTVWVDKLFYNTPARRKFLKSERTEYEHIEEVFKRIALSRYDIAFTLKHNQKTVYQLPAIKENQEPIVRIKKLLGNAVFEQLQMCSQAAAGLSIQGWISRPDLHHSQKDKQYFYVNGRIIRDKVISHAIQQVYSELIPAGRYPAFVLYLTLEPDQVDVNVHPTKHEVRFRQARLIHDFIVTSLQKTLFQHHNAIEKKTMAIAENSHESSLPRSSYVTNQTYSPNQAVHHVIEETRALYRPTETKILAKIEDIYLICEHEQLNIVLLDVHAAFSQLAKSKLENSPTSLNLLIPETVKIKSDALDILEQHKLSLSEIGFDWDRLGEQHLVLRSVPDVLRYANYTDLIETLISHQPQASIELLINNLACRAKPMRLSIVDKAFLNAVLSFVLDNQASPKRCNHGRESYICLDKEKLESSIVKTCFCKNQ